MRFSTYLGEGTVVPEVTLVGEAVANVAELALLGVLLDGVEELLLGDLNTMLGQRQFPLAGFRSAYLLLGVGPAGNLNDHVEDCLLSVGIEGDIVEGRDRLAILLDVHPVLQGEGLADLADGIGHCGRRRGSGGSKMSRD